MIHRSFLYLEKGENQNDVDAQKSSWGDRRGLLCTIYRYMAVNLAYRLVGPLRIVNVRPIMRCTYVLVLSHVALWSDYRTHVYTGNLLCTW